MSSLEKLIAKALKEQRRETAKSPVPRRVQIQALGSREVFDAAVKLCGSTTRSHRRLGVSILRELGPADENGRRPFSEEAIPLLASMLEVENRADLERNLLQALAFNGAREALPAFLARLTHPDAGVRETVAFQLPYLVDASEPASVVDALHKMCADEDPEVRYLAFYALAEEDLEPDRTKLEQLARVLRSDSDPRIRDMADEVLRSSTH